MKTTVMNPVKAFTLFALGLAIAAMGIYVADADDAPGAAVIGMLLMTVGVVLGVRAARTSSRARPTAAAYYGDGAESMTDGTSCDCGKRGALTTTRWVRNAANAATTMPTASAVFIRAVCTQPGRGVLTRP